MTLPTTERPKSAARSAHSHKHPLRVLMVFDMPFAPKPDHDYAAELADRENHATEDDVHRALLANGYEVRPLGLYDDIKPLIDAVHDFQPDVIFNLVETFQMRTRWEKNVAALIEMLGVPCTGAGSAALFLCNDKGLSRRILRDHRIHGPRFQLCYRGYKVRLPHTMRLPCIVKPLNEEASRGISQASVVDDEKALIERVRMIHERMDQDAIVEEYIDGRELYVSIVGDRRLRVLPAREMTFGQMSEHEPRIATYKAKWDDAYRDKWGIRNDFAEPIEPALQRRINEVCRRAYRALNLRSYARFDLRVTSEGEVCVIEPNVNPNIGCDDELAQSAKKIGIGYAALIRLIVNQALRQNEK